jgi:tetratricopeptide (TPR) repeat protein
MMVALAVGGCGRKDGAGEDDFTRLTNLGRSQLDQGEGTRAAEYFQQALQAKPTSLEARLNLANAFLLANRPAEAIREAGEALRLEPNSAAAHYIAGCAWLRAGDATNALKSLQQSHAIDVAVTALNFQLGLAHEALGQAEDAIRELQTVVEHEPEHRAAHYRLSQLLLRQGRGPEAAEALRAHQAILAKAPGVPGDVATFEKCKHTAARLPFRLEQPLARGIAVAFTDATAAVLPGAARLQGPLGVIDLAHDGRHSLFVREGEAFRLLANPGQGRPFQAAAAALPGIPGARYAACLVGDLQNDGTEDALLLGDRGSQLFRFSTNGAVTEVTRGTLLTNLAAADGVLLDFDYTGKLGLIVLQPDGRLRYLRNLSSPFALYFSELNVTSGLPATVTGGAGLAVEDLNGDELLDLLLARDGAEPLVFTRQRGGPFVATNLAPALPAAPVLAPGDLNNDSLPDVAAATAEHVEVRFAGGVPARRLPLGGFRVRALALVDYDNDGWLDLLAAGSGGLRAWRNLGAAGFQDATAALGLERAVRGPLAHVAAADFDQDCDTDVVVAGADGGLQFLRNDGGNAHRQLKLQLVGRRSNQSALGVKFEVSAGGLRAWRTVQRLPVEVGVGRRAKVDSLAVRWFDVVLNNDDLNVADCQVLTLHEIEKPTGSCPYLYAWDGQGFRFVTDLLGAAPLGLRVSDTRFVEADPPEFVPLGDERAFPPRGTRHVLQVTEELREVLYLDEAKLAVVDRPPGTEVHTTGKLVPGAPFPRHELVTLERRQALRQAVNHEGADVTAALQQADRVMVSPTRLRGGQLRGLAEPHAVTLDFGPLDPAQPLVLALTGWLRFGGGMANVGAAHTPGLPFPFPVLEAEVAAADGPPAWRPVDVVVGSPAGKTKTILVELAGRLPAGTRRLRLGAAFEIHWDRIALFHRRAAADTRVTLLAPTRTDLHWRGFSEFADLPWFLPLTPDYRTARSHADWTLTPAGWCTRYGAVDELIARRDDALALVNGGDELTLEWETAALPPRVAGMEREFFFYSVGWDKDADFHCELGWQVEPLPWHGMDAQRYGREPRPELREADALMRRYNTRWVGPRTLARPRQTSPAAGGR